MHGPTEDGHALQSEKIIQIFFFFFFSITTDFIYWFWKLVVIGREEEEKVVKDPILSTDAAAYLIPQRNSFHKLTFTQAIMQLSLTFAGPEHMNL